MWQEGVVAELIEVVNKRGLVDNKMGERGGRKMEKIE
jgi:hypothetical protein